MKKYWREILLAIIVVFLVIPLSIAFSVSFRFICTDTSNVWIGFWGGYLGAIIGAIVAIYVMRKTLENESNRRKEEERERFFSEICELVAEYCFQINESNCHLLRFHQTGEPEWNYEALYTKGEATKIEHILQIKLLSRKVHSYNLSTELLESILEVGKSMDKLHDVTVNSFEELAREADKLSEKLSNLMELVYRFISENEM